MAREYNEGSVEASEVGVKAVDDQTLEVQLKSPTPYFPNLTTMDMFFPVNEAFCEEQGTNFALSPRQHALLRTVRDHRL